MKMITKTYMLAMAIMALSTIVVSQSVTDNVNDYAQYADQSLTTGLAQEVAPAVISLQGEPGDFEPGSNPFVSKVEQDGKGPTDVTKIWVLPTDYSSSSNGRAPSNFWKYQRTKYIITPAEMANSGFPSGSLVSSIGFFIRSAGIGTLTGTLKVWLQNTADVNYLQGNTWNVTGYTLVHVNPSFTVPISPAYLMYDETFIGGSPFTYTGGGVYVAWEFESPAGTIGTTAVVHYCNTDLTGGLAGYRGSTQGTALTASNWRPATRFGTTSFDDIVKVTHIYTLEKVPTPFGTPAPVSVRVENVTGAPVTFDLMLEIRETLFNTLRHTETQVNVNIPADSSTVVNFTAWNPVLLENVNVIAFTSAIPDESWTINNTLTIPANVNDDLYSYFYPYTPENSFGFPVPDGGIFSAKYTMNGAGTVFGANIFLANYAANVGNTIYAVLQNSAGTIVSQTANYVIQAGDLGTLKSFNFPSPTSFNNEDFYIGLAQTYLTGAVSYYPLGIIAGNPARENTFYEFPLVGGIPSANEDFYKFMIEAIVGAGVNNDVATLSVDMIGPFAPQAIVINNGIVTQTFNVEMTIAPGGYSSTQTVVSLPPGGTQLVTFDPWSNTIGDYLVTVCTQLGGDVVPANDCKSQNIKILENIIAYQYYYDTDPGVGVPGNGAVVPITPTGDFNTTVAITLPALSPGFHNLYIRTKDTGGQWSLAVRKPFVIQSATITENIVAYQYFFDTDPGVGVTGNGAVVPISSTDDFNTTVAITLPALTPGFHNLYIRTKDTGGQWSLAERRPFVIQSATITENIVAYQYFFDTDPGVGVAGNGAVVPILSTDDFNSTLAISLPTLAPGFHNLYIRTKDTGGQWSLAARKPFVITQYSTTEFVTAMEYYYDTDPGVGNANPINVTATPSFNGVVELGIPCLATGTHYVYVRAKNEYGHWSIIGRDTLQITGGIDPSEISPAGPITFCPLDSIILSIDSIPGIVYQWQKDAVDIPMANASTLVIHEAGSYQVKAYCGVVFSTSDPVTVNVLPLLTFYADADGDGYGNILIDSLDCTQPAGYVTNSADCDDSNNAIHPAAPEICNGIDDNCDSQIDEGVMIAYYADADGDGFGDLVVFTQACTMPAGFVGNSADCNDTNPAINPLATEICNLIDDDCDSFVDEDVQLTFYADNDLDGYGDPFITILACTPPSGFVVSDGDCDDTDPGINPDATETCNGFDDNCDGNIDEGFVYSIAGTSISSSIGESFCLGGSTLLSLNDGLLGTGAEWQWYEGGCGSGSPIGSGLSISVTPSAGDHTYSVRAEGECNNSNCVSIVIDVNEAPSFTLCPADIFEGNDMNTCTALVSYNMVLGGNPAPELTYSFSGVTVGGGLGSGSGSVFNAGTTFVTVTATNDCGTSACSFNITIEDTQAPEFAGCPSNITVEAEEGQWGATVSWTPPAATDNCSAATLISNHQPGDFFNVGTTIVTYTATDEADNSSDCQFFVTVTPPDFLGTVNISVLSSDITFSDNNPDPGTSINVNALIRNNSNIDAGSFTVRFTDLLTNTAYPLIAVPGLNAGQSILVNEFISAPNVPAFVPIQVSIDVDDELDESSEFDNSAVRPFICGDLALPGNVDVQASAVPASVPAGSTIQICGSASYDTSPPLDDPSVAGSEVIITIVETGQQFSGYTDENGSFCISYNTPNTPGEYHFTVDITDNTLSGDAAGTFTLTEPVYVCPKDLTVSIELTGINPSISGSYIVAVGTTFSGTVYVMNNCTGISLQTKLYIAPPVGTLAPYEVIIPGLSPGETYPVSLINFTLNSQGEFFISATVDYNNDIPDEASETNNTAYEVIMVLPPFPDIVAVGGTVLSDLECFENNHVNFTVKNAGLVPTGPFTSVFSLYVNGVFQSDQSQQILNLNPGESTILSFPFTVTSTTDTLRFDFVADEPDDVEELSEFNNSYSFKKIFRECLPDLVVMGCEFTDVKPADPMSGGTVTVTATIKNQGELAVTDQFDVIINIAGTQVTQTITDPLAPQQSLVLSASAPVPVDECATLIVSVDTDETITEHHENNNDYSAPLCYDFELTNLNCYGVPIFPAKQYSCNPGNFIIGFWNFGLYEASDFEVKFEISGPGLTGWVHLGTESIYSGISCDCNSVISYSGIFLFPQTGQFQVRMTADPNDLYLESDEMNNQIVMNLTVVESADYEVLSPYIFPSDINPDINETVSFSVSYTNTGCSGFSQMELYTMMDNDLLDALIVDPLPAGGWNNVAIPNTWSSSVPGVHVFRAIIDYGEIIPEANELNNEATKAIIVGGVPDYNVLSISVSDETPQIGEIVTISTSVLNEGQSTGSGTLRFIIADSQDNETIIGEVPISLIPGTSGIYSYDWPVSDPHARIIARVVNVVPMEFDLSDNEKEMYLNDLVVTLAGTDVMCHGDNSGTISVNVTGGTPSFTYTWSDPSLFGSNVPVAAGTYSVTVTDANGLSRNETITIGEPDLLVVSTTFTPILCYGGSSTVTIAASGGTEPYTGTGDFVVVAGTHSFIVTDTNGCMSNVEITITEPDELVTSATFTPILCYDGSSIVTVSATGGTQPFSGTGDFVVVAGTHSFTVTDANGCLSNVTVTISEPDELIASATFTPILCYGGSSIVTVSATGGTQPYSGTGDFVVNAGTHSFIVTDTNGCMSNVEITITEPDELVVSATFTPILCYGGSSTVSVSATGGTQPFSGTGDFVVNAGTHSFIVTDTNGCMSNVEITITEPDELVTSTTFTPILCYGGSSIVTVSATGGTQPYSGTGDFVVVAGTHSYTVTDANGCMSSVTILVTEPDELIASATFTPIFCYGGSSTVSVSATGGTQPFSGTGDFVVVAGTHSFTVTDANGCMSNVEITITEPDELVTSATFTPILCYGGSSTVSVSATGGTQPFSGTGDFVVNAGTHSFTVTDANGCMSNVEITITEPDELILSETHADASCDNLNDGSINLSVTGGSEPYSYYWSNGVTSQDLSNVGSGSYMVTVTDNNGCKATMTVVLTNLNEAVLWYQDADNDGFGNNNVSMLSCSQPNGYTDNNDDCNDNDAAINPSATEICNNNVDDNCNGLIDEDCSNPCDLSVEAGIDVSTYFGYLSLQGVSRTAIVSGGTPPFNYSWSMSRPLLCNQVNATGDESFYGGTCINNSCPVSGSPIESPYCSGNATITAILMDTATICVTVTDANGCLVTDCFTVMASDVRCFAGNSGNHKIKICHHTNSPKNPWVEICVDTNAISAHFAHGDYIGWCNPNQSVLEIEEEEEFNLNLTLFPNPAESSVTIVFNSRGVDSYTIELIDMTGRKLSSYRGDATHGENTRELNLDHFEPGMYHVTLILDGMKEEKKLIVK